MFIHGCLFPKTVTYGLEKALTCKCHAIESKSLIKVLTVEAGNQGTSSGCEQEGCLFRNG